MEVQVKYQLSNILSYEDIINNDIKSVGTKAYNVALLSKSFNVPRGIVVMDIPDDVKKIIELLKCDKYIVRSSSNVEDGSNLSWAGCFDSIPDLSKRELKEAIKKCIDSKDNQRVKEYMKLHNISKEVTVSVLIQEYMESDFNGVAFSSNPVSDSDEEYVIEIQEGLTGNVVGGYGNSETLVINKKHPIIDSSILNSKLIKLNS